MAEEWSPIVISATFTPVTANVGDSVLLQVIVLDVQTIEQEEIIHVDNYGKSDV